MTTNDTIKRIEQLFNEEIEKKTGWGKNEIKVMFHAIIRVAMGEYIDYVEKGGEDEVFKQNEYLRNIIKQLSDVGDGYPPVADKIRKILRAHNI